MVTGGCGFIGSNFIRYLLAADPEVAVVNLDALTYAGNLANLADLADHPRYRFVQGDITDRDAVRSRRPTGRRPRSSTSRPRATSIAASTTPGRSSAPTCSARRSCSTPPASSPSQRFVQVSTDEVYGSLGPTGLFTEETPLAPEQPLLRQQGGRRPARAQLRPHLRPAGAHHALLEQLRSVPVSREADPAVHHATCCATSRCRSTATACKCATGFTSATTAPAIERGLAGGPRRRGLQHRRPLRDRPTWS